MSISGFNLTGSENLEQGIWISHASACTIKNNTFVKSGIYISGSELGNWNSHTIGETNTINGKPLFYYKNQTDITVHSGAGQIILANCTRIIVEDQNYSNSVVGILIGYSSFISLENNLCSKNLIGIELYQSRACLLENNICKNNIMGTNLYFSSACILENNNFMNNSIGLYLVNSNDCTIINSTFSMNILYGIDLINSYNCTIKENTISKNNVGIRLKDSSLDSTIHYNTIYSNTEYGTMISDKDHIKVNATYNYWGSNTGPYHPTLNPYGNGDRITDFSEFDPWTGKSEVLLPDLIIESFTCTPNSPEEGTIATLTAKVKNIGFVHASDFTIHFNEIVSSAQNRQLGLPNFNNIDSFSIDHLGVLNSISVNVTWDTIGKLGHNILWVAAGTSPTFTRQLVEFQDLNESNNEKSINVTVKEAVASYSVELTSDQYVFELEGKNVTIINIAIMNTGEVRDSYRVILSGTYDGWNATIEAPDILTLAPGTSQLFTLVLMENSGTDNENNRIESKKITVTLTAISVTHEEVQDSVTIEGNPSSEDEGFSIPFLPPAAIGFGFAAGGMIAFFRRRRIL